MFLLMLINIKLLMSLLRKEIMVLVKILKGIYKVKELVYLGRELEILKI